MALVSYNNVSFAGLSVCLPSKVEENSDFTELSEKELKRFIKNTGIERRRVAQAEQCTSDFCEKAATQLLTELNWDKSEIDILILVTQTPDYITPATAVILQNKLGLAKSCLAFDVNLGCSGYVYGLSIIAGMMANGGLRKGLLMVGDVSTKSLNKRDKSTYPLFSDAGTVTALEYKKGHEMHFNLQSDGQGYEAIMIEDGGFRNQVSQDSFIEKEVSEGIIRSRLNLILDGTGIFNFALREVAPNIKALYEFSGIGEDQIDYFIFHQANKLLNEFVRDKLKLAEEKVPYSLKDYGNTSCATIPVTMATQIREALNEGKSKLCLSGFGVGLSWGSAIIDIENVVCPPVTEL